MAHEYVVYRNHKLLYSTINRIAYGLNMKTYAYIFYGFGSFIKVYPIKTMSSLMFLCKMYTHCRVKNP